MTVLLKKKAFLTFFTILGIMQLLAGCSTVFQTDPTPGTSGKKQFYQRVSGFDLGGLNCLVDDMDGNGLPDLIFTSHGPSFSQVFYQDSPRKWQKGPRIVEVGFHPNGIIRLPGASKTFISVSEGINQLICMRPDQKTGLRVEGRVGLAQPRFATPFKWPGWNLSLAVSPYSGRVVSILKNFDSKTCKGDEIYYLVPKEPGVHDIPGRIEAADIDGDGIAELLFTTRRTDELWQIKCPDVEERPLLERLWKFPGGKAEWVIPFDFDLDDDLDLIVPQAVTSELTILENDGQGTFKLNHNISFPVPPGPSYTEIKRDENGNVIIAAGAYHFMVLMRIRGGNWKDIETLRLPVATWPSYINLEDIDRDGFLDLVATMKGSGTAPLIVYGPLWRNFEKLAQSGDCF